MSCYHPLIGIPENDLNENGKRQYKIIGKFYPELTEMYPGAIQIPCGKCLGCRLDYSRTWADRMMLELDHTGKAIFITLTYNNEHVPFTEDPETGLLGCYSLYKRDLQLFFKRFRKEFDDREVRFYACGEYGSSTDRPHYHAIIFGVSLDDFPDRKPLGKNELGQVHYDSKRLDKIWSIYHKKEKYYEPIGFTVLADVSWKSCAYVSRYVQKKVFQSKFYLQDIFEAEPEFSLMSRRPGIGARFIEDHPDFFDYDNHYVVGKDSAIVTPKYLLKKLETIDKERYDAIMEEKKEMAVDATFSKCLATDLDYCEQLEVEEEKKMLKSTALKRLL